MDEDLAIINTNTRNQKIKNSSSVVETQEDSGWEEIDSK